MSNPPKIRNFCIIAHIDHGKSTLSDRIIEMTNGLEKREMKEQVLDSMDLERERGITIKLNAVELHYKDYLFHLIDTPGHIDFTYEVSRSLAACEGAILVVDATQGVEAQTLSNVFLALENDLEILPVINKIDLPSADIEKTKKDIFDTIGLDATNAICISAKTGLNVDLLLEEIVKKIPAPIVNEEAPLKALIFDMYYDAYKGVVCLIRIVDGRVKVNQKIKMMSTNKEFIVSELGIRTPKIINKKELCSGEVGWIACNIKSARDVGVGDTVTDASNPTAKALGGYKKILPMVFAGIFPVDNSEFDALKTAMEKIALSDSSLTYEYETSQALGYGIRCGFLGLLHMDVIKERISREYNVEIVLTPPSVKYELNLTNGKSIVIDNPSYYPDRTTIALCKEPFVKLYIISPQEYIGGVMELCQRYRGAYKDLQHLDGNRLKITYEIPLAEIITSFFDTLKTISQGYATMDYELIDYKETDLVKVDILLNGDKVDAFGFICHKDSAQSRGRTLVEKLRKHISRQQFEVPVQAAIGGKIIARETIKAYSKDVIKKIHGGHATDRKRKLLDAQKEGKKRLKAIGSVSVEPDVFIKILQND
ncbi:MAG: translation elongation factor 4 [Mycoplasmoidaceae bacterium]|nr:MAG: translation elongation factor 4 [Mycoplasmoidaceae bacterium]